MGISPKIFGPHVWFVVHAAAANYPQYPDTAEQSEMVYFIKSLPAIIPCPPCQNHTRIMLVQNAPNIPWAVKSRDNLFAFFVDLHNQVNSKLGKREWTLEEAWKKYGKL